MSICTGKGDGGFSSLSDGKLCPKSDLCFEALGNLDELSACLGLAKTVGGDMRILEEFQHILIKIMSYISCGEEKYCLSHKESDIELAHAEIKLAEFVLPGKNELSARLDYARTVARRAERSYVRIGERADKGAIVFLNRLSDALFVMAREAEK